MTEGDSIKAMGGAHVLGLEKEGDPAEGEVMGTIDRKVESRSAMDMTVDERRATPRFPVRFHATVSGSTQPDGAGILLDLSRGAGAGWKARFLGCGASH